MIKISTAQLWVNDQEEALAFYTQKLGMEVRIDVTMAEMGNFRWLTVAPPGQQDVAIVLMAIPGPPVMDAETAEQVRAVVAKGFAGTIFLTTDDCYASYVSVAVTATLIADHRGVFSKRAALRAPVGANDAGRDERVLGRGREPGAVGGGRVAERPREGGREGAQALQADREADIGDRAVGAAQHRRGPLQSAREQVGVRGLAERAAELAAEVRRREPGGASEVRDRQRLAVASVGKVLGAQQVAGGRSGSHQSGGASRRAATYSRASR